MCGITGAVWDHPSLAISREVLARMIEVLRHRGPDDRGEYYHTFTGSAPAGVALGFRRLAIIDLATGHQPLCNEDQTVWVILNGEIYNFRALRHRLEATGHRFRSRSDTEVIVHLYEDEGLDCFRHFNGMFALAIWDQKRQRLVLARDRLGKKPLVYSRQPGRLLFASELKSLLQVPEFPRDLDFNAIDEYLTYQYVPHPNTIFRHIRKLPPGHLAVYEQGRLQVQPYWECPGGAEVAVKEEAAAEELCQLLESAVKLRLQSDVPLGAFLSGGIDSSLIVALMQRHVGQPVKTFSIGFPIREYDESRYALEVARHVGTEHHPFQVEPDALEVLPRLVWHFDEPFADSSAIPTWYVSRLTRQHVTVALSGDGGDELFVGYPRYRAVWLASRLDRHHILRRLLASPLWQLLPSPARQKSILRRWKRFSEALAREPWQRYLDWISIFNELRRAALYRDEFLQVLGDCDPVYFLRQAAEKFRHRDPVTQTALVDLVTYLPCDLMTKVDIASMAHGLECRQPFLDYRLVEWAAQLPLKLKMRRGRGKWLVRRALGHLLPASVLKRRKMGFGVPLDHWFRGPLRPLVHDLLLQPSARCTDWFRTDVLRELVHQHETGRFDHSYRLWALVVLEMWLRQWDIPATLPPPTGQGASAAVVPSHDRQ